MPKDEQKIQGYIPLYNVWVLEQLVAAGHIGVNKNDAVSNIVLQWFDDNKKLIRENRLTTAEYAKLLKKRGPLGIVPPEAPPEPKGVDRDEGHPTLIELKAPVRRRAGRR
ncbi:MAG TPA: hypothetical protein VHQ90_06590 [Thermoanaerobaculia bacterium]|nr:hypothetical protein [Thermoanaerobaculia bacterium]